MEILIAEHAGFCFGVRRAIRAVQEQLSPPKRIYTLGPIIHNPQVVRELQEKGVVIEEDVARIAEGTVIIRSHGISEAAAQEIEQKGLQMIDATCPYVKRIHELVRKHSQEGLPILIIGERDHPEVAGIQGWSNGCGWVVYEAEDVDRLPPFSKACVVVQTTTTQEKCETILEILHQKIPDLIFFNTICRATAERQQEAEEIAKQANVVFVVGGRNSSNTRKLVELSKRHCAHTYAVETACGILPEYIKPSDVVGITAGASTPDWIIKEVVEKMNELKDEFLEAQAPSAEPTEAVEPEKAPESEEVPESADAPEAEAPEIKTHEIETPKAETPETTAPEEEEVSTMEGFEKTMVSLKPGQIIQGTVLSVSDEQMIVNVGYKSDGIIPAEEVALEAGQKPSDLYKEGDSIDAAVLKVKDEDGNVLLSQKSIANRKVWKELEQAMEQGAEVSAVAMEMVKGGLIAKIKGVQAFVPASHVATRYVADLKGYVGQPLRLKILEMDRQRSRVVASQKAILEAEEAQAKEAFWSNVQEGKRILGEVKRLTNFGAFVDVGGVDGLIHVSDLAWGHVGHPREVVKEGQQVEVVVLSADQAKDRISLGYKQLMPHPWDHVEERYPAGSIQEGKVVRITTFGAFVELEPGIDGLVHISQVADHRIAKVEDAVKQGDRVRVKVLDVKAKERRISLSIREALEAPQLEQKKAKEDAPQETYQNQNEEMTVALGDFFPEELTENQEDKE